MASSKKIETKEVIDPALFAQNVKDAEAFKIVLQDLISGLKGVKLESDKILGKKGLFDSNDIKEKTAALNQSKQARDGLNQAEKVSAQLTERQIALNQLEAKSRRERINEIKNTIAQTELEEGSIAKLRLELSKAQKAYDNLSAAKRNSAKGKELEISIASQTAALNKLEQATGRFQRNVGNYASGFNGLSNSINQIGRELPNFAIRFETGIQALSNNIPILADEINRVKKANLDLKAEGKPTVSLFKQLAGAIFSWQTAITIGITALIAFAPAIKEFFTGVKEGADDTERLKREQEELNEALKDYLNIIDDTRIERLPQILADLRNNGSEFLSINDLKQGLSEIDARLESIRVRREKIEGIGLVTSEEFRRDAEIQRKALLEDRRLIQSELDKRDFRKKEKKKKENNEDLKREEEYLSALQKLVEDWINTGIEMETDKFEKELRLENESHRKLIDELNSYLGKSEAINRQVNKNIEQENERHFKEIIRIALQASAEQNAETNKLYDDEITRKKDADEKLAKLERDRLAKIAELRKKERLKDVDENLKFLQTVTQQVIVELDKQSDAQQSAFDKENAKREKSIDRQAELAAQGLDNQLAFEQAQLAKNELKQKQALEKAQREKEAAQLTESFFSFLNSELQAGTPAGQATSKALFEALGAKAIAKGLVQFAAEGNDMIEGPGSTTSDSIPFMLSKKEAVIKASENIKHNDAVKSLNAGTFDQNFIPRFKYSEVVNSSTLEAKANNYLINEAAKQTEILKRIENKPVQQVNYDSYGNLIETIYMSGVKSVITHKNSRPRL